MSNKSRERAQKTRMMWAKEDHPEWICPRCGHLIPNDETPGKYPGALSRRDNETEICSACGTVEAMEDWMKEPFGESRVKVYWNPDKEIPRRY